MQSLSEPMRITVSERTYQIIRKTIPCIAKGEIESKGDDKIKFYVVDAPEPEIEAAAPAPSGE